MSFIVSIMPMTDFGKDNLGDHVDSDEDLVGPSHEAIQYLHAVKGPVKPRCHGRAPGAAGGGEKSPPGLGRRNLDYALFLSLKDFWVSGPDANDPHTKLEDGNVKRQAQEFYCKKFVLFIAVQ